MQATSKPTTVFYDGSCPLCRAEIDHYRACDAAGALRLVDISTPGAPLPPSLDRTSAMARFHALAPDGRLLSGAAAFAEVWRRLPRWRVAARVAAAPGVLPMLEAAYRTFLPLRPILVRLFVRLRVR